MFFTGVQASSHCRISGVRECWWLWINALHSQYSSVGACFLTVSQQPKLLKSVVANGRIYIRSIQKDLDISPVGDVDEVENQISVVCYKELLGWIILRDSRFFLIVGGYWEVPNLWQADAIERAEKTRAVLPVLCVGCQQVKRWLLFVILV